MAFIACPACSKQVSDRAPKCVHCGGQLSVSSPRPRRGRSFLAGAGLLFGINLLVSVLGGTLFWIDSGNGLAEYVSYPLAVFSFLWLFQWIWVVSGLLIAAFLRRWWTLWGILAAAAPSAPAGPRRSVRSQRPRPGPGPGFK